MSVPNKRGIARLAACLSCAAALGTCADGPDSLGPFTGMRLASADSVFVFDEPDLGSDPGLPLEQPAPDTLVGSLLYGAFVDPVDTAVSDDPMDLWMRVRVTNPADTPATLPVRGCTVWPEVYDSPDRDAPPLWVPAGQCAEDPYSVGIEPGDSAELSFLAYDGMLGYALPDGRYYVTLRFRRATDSLRLDAGSADVRLRKPGLTYHVSLSQEGAAVHARVTVANANDVPVPLEFGACSLGIDVYRDVRRTQRLASWRGPYVCAGYLAIATLQPGDSLTAREFESDFVLGWLGGKVTPGVYYLAVQLGLNWRTLEFPLGVVSIW